MPPVDFEHWLFAGTRALAGRAEVRVVYVGGETLYGEIVRSARTGASDRTPAQRAIARLVATLTTLAVALCVLLGVVRLSQGFGWVDATVSALTLAVAALPEEFPVVFTFFLGVGVYRLARRRALVRRAPPQRSVAGPRRSSSSSSVRGQSCLSRRDSARSASRRPPVWQRAQ